MRLSEIVDFSLLEHLPLVTKLLSKNLRNVVESGHKQVCGACSYKISKLLVIGQLQRL